MPTTTIRLSERAREEARELARLTGKPISQAVESAIRRERRRLFFAQYRHAAAAVAADAGTAEQEAAELALYETTLMDGLEDEHSPE